MILMRFAGIKGDCNIPGYNDWITLTSFSFGVGREIEKENQGRDIQISRAEAQEVTISKSVDCATVDLMYKAIKDRTPGDTNTPVAVEIHFVEPREEAKTGKGNIKAYLKIKLGRVLIASWSIDGSDEDRPTEDLGLHFNQIAMEYQASPDGKTFLKYGPRGWDQAAKKDWKPEKWQGDS